MGSTGIISSVDTSQLRYQAESAVKSLSASKRTQGLTITRPVDGHDISIFIEKVTHRDYWGKSTGEKSYTIYIDDKTQLNDYGNPTRLYYNYGMDSFKTVKNEVKRILSL